MCFSKWKQYGRNAISQPSCGKKIFPFSQRDLPDRLQQKRGHAEKTDEHPEGADLERRIAFESALHQNERAAPYCSQYNHERPGNSLLLHDNLLTAFINFPE